MSYLEEEELEDGCITISSRYLEGYSIGSIIMFSGSSNKDYNGSFIINDVVGRTYYLIPNTTSTIVITNTFPKKKSKIKPTIFDRLNQSKESKGK